MSGNRKVKQPTKGQKSKPKAVAPSGLVDHRVHVADTNGSDTICPNPENKTVLKVEMRTITLSKELQNKMMDTLREIHGENFTLKDRNQYVNKKSTLSHQYWMDRGGLVVTGGVDYSQRNRTRPSHELNGFALSKLKGYGFHENHCVEALQFTNGDMGVALELLLFHYLYKTAQTPDKEDQDSSTEDYLADRSDEKCSLESMFGDAFEERIQNRVWTLKLDLPYLLEQFPTPSTSTTSSEKKTKSSSVAVCNFIASGRTCRFGSKCKFSHEIPARSQQVVKNTVDTQFLLEVRFPPECKYPYEAPYVCLSTEIPDFPPFVCLRITSRLMEEAVILSIQKFPSVYSLMDLLCHQQSEILTHLGKIGKALPDPSLPIIAMSNKGGDIHLSSEEFIGGRNETDSSSRQQRSAVNLERQVQRQDEILARKFMEKTKSEPYQRFLEVRKTLPAWRKMEDILEAVEHNQVVVISGETGCGKSTQVPQFFLDDWLLNFYGGDKKACEIVCTQPRRLSAIGVAERVAEERVERIGDLVGYQIRLERKLSSRSRLMFCTTGILLRRLENDSNLKTVTHIVVDEVHERSEESDFLLLILRDLLPRRPDLRVILMSATMNSELFSSYFSGAPVVEISGRSHPVEKIFLDEIIEDTNYSLEENSQFARRIKEKKRNGIYQHSDTMECDLSTADVVTTNMPPPKDIVRDEMLSLPQLLQRYQGRSMQTVKSLYLMEPEKINYDLIETVLTWIVAGNHSYPQQGSVLVFLPGIAEIRTLYRQLIDHPVLTPRVGNFVIVPLHSSLTSEEQTAVFRKPKKGVRKIVLATNIAETSITIDDCVFVVDTGRMKQTRFDANKNMESLELTWISRANAAQRRGRAGRVMPGVCIHLYTQNRHDNTFLREPIPELHRVPLEQPILRTKVLSCYGNRNIHQIFERLIETPDKESVDSSILRLQFLGALDDSQELTPLGHHLARLPVDVRIGKLMLFGAMFSCLDSALTIAACLSYKSPFTCPFDKREEADAKKKQFAVGNSDQLTCLEAYTKWLKASAISRRCGDVFAEENFLSWRTLTTIADMKHQFLDLLVDIGFVDIQTKRRHSGEDCVLKLSGTAYNENGNNRELIAAILCAALYPNLVRVLTPAKTYAQSGAGAIPKDLSSQDISFKTKLDGFVSLHPSSVNFGVHNFASPYLVYQEKVKTTRIYLRDSTMVSALPLVLLTGKEMTVELLDGSTALSLEEGWMVFLVENHQVAELLQMMRVELEKILQEKIKDPSLNLFQNPKSRKVLSTIISLVTQG